METILRNILGSDRSKHFPPIKRGSNIDVYLTSSGQHKKEKVIFINKKSKKKTSGKKNKRSIFCFTYRHVVNISCTFYYSIITIFTSIHLPGVDLAIKSKICLLICEIN